MFLEYKIYNLNICRTCSYDLQLMHISVDVCQEQVMVPSGGSLRLWTNTYETIKNKPDHLKGKLQKH